MARSSTARDWHVDRPLSNLSIAFVQTSEQFIASKVGTPIPVSHESDKYTEYPQGYWNREYDSTRAEEGVANSVNYNTKERNYSIGDKALRIFISDRKRANADNIFNLDNEGQSLVSNSLMIGEEIDFRDKFLVTGKWSLDKVGVASGPTGDQFLKWSDAASDPVGDYKTARRAFILRTAGKKPNEIAMTLDVFDTLTEHPAIIDRIKTTVANMPATISLDMIAGLFEVDKINIISTMVNTASDAVEDGNGDVPVNNTFLVEGVFLPMHNAATGGLLTATAIGNFYLPTFTGSDLGPRFRRYRAVEGKDGEYIEGQIRVDRRIISADMGELWSAVL
jgi:hypothetical protein